MELFLIRHGESENNWRPTLERVEDALLSEIGQKQVICLGKWMASLGLSDIYTSPFRRTLQTTQAIIDHVELTPQIHIDLHEKGGCISGVARHSFKGCTGITRSEIEMEFPGYRIPDDLDDLGWWKNKPLETEDQLLERAERIVEFTCKQFLGSEKKVAYVMHADLKRFLLAFWLQKPEIRTDAWGKLFNTGVTKLTIEHRRVKLDMFNSIGHLPGDLVTPVGEVQSLL